VSDDRPTLSGDTPQNTGSQPSSATASAPNSTDVPGTPSAPPSDPDQSDCEQLCARNANAGCNTDGCIPDCEEALNADCSAEALQLFTCAAELPGVCLSASNTDPPDQATIDRLLAGCPAQYAALIARCPPTAN
jgi:hypothetical protein